MKNLHKLASLAIVAFSLQFATTDAQADFIGNNLTIEWHFSSLGSIIASETGVVGAGIEFVERLGGSNVDVGSTTIDFFGANSQSYSAGAFNGFVFTDSSDSIADFLGISITGQTGYTGFDLADINVTANRIEVNFASVGSINGPDNSVQLTVRFAAVPEPGTLALLGIGLFGMGLARRRKAV